LYKFEVILTYGTHFVFADDYSNSKGKYFFWITKPDKSKPEVVRSFLQEEVIDIIQHPNHPTFFP
jgi:hypothetical protein